MRSFRAGVHVQKLKRILSLLPYAYLLRFPLLTAGAIVGICVATALSASARSLLANAFDIGWFSGIFWLSLVAFVSAWVVMITWRLVRLYGPERFGTAPYRGSANIKWWHVALFSGPIALPIVGGAIYYTARNNAWRTTEVMLGVLFALLGALAALFLLLVADFLQRLFTRRDVAIDRPADTARGSCLAQKSPDVFLPSRAGFVTPIVDWAKEREPISRPDEWIRRLFGWVPENVGRGYFKYKNGEVRYILPGHGSAATLFVLTFVLYALFGIFKFLRLGETPSFPTLAYILLLLMLLCWGLSGLAFFLDRFRIPVIIPLLVLFLITASFPWSDHFYPVTDTQPTAEDSTSTSDDRIVVVAANGGGIQAAAWTARVLTGLEEELGEDFGRSIRVVSSVSGGSVGAMYFVNEYTPDGPPSGEELGKIVERAEGSSLDEVAWGLVYPDLIRLFTSYGSEWDRGRALEQAWLRHDLTWDNRNNVRAGLSEWREGVAAGWRPGSIFNTTNADSGARLPLSTIELPDSEGKENQDQLFESLRSKDIPVLTATRLSASFPFISPAARAPRAEIGGDKAAHIVDGGYYDNYGISSLVEWLDAELEKGDVEKVLVLQIRGSRTGGNYDFESNRGWFYQAFAPLGTLLHVRDTGQLSHNDIELDLLKDKWEEKSKREEKNAMITPVVFEFSGADPPLSWHLNEQEKENIEADWSKELKGSKPRPEDQEEPSLDVVREFIAQS